MSKVLKEHIVFHEITDLEGPSGFKGNSIDGLSKLLSVYVVY